MWNRARASRSRNFSKCRNSVDYSLCPRTTFLNFEASFVFLIAWLFQMKIEYFQTLRKRDFDCWAFSFFETLPGCQQYSHSASFFLFVFRLIYYHNYYHLFLYRNLSLTAVATSCMQTWATYQTTKTGRFTEQALQRFTLTSIILFTEKWRLDWCQDYQQCET